MSFGLFLNEILIINAIFKKYSEIEFVIIYGSRAKGNYKNESDIDLTFIGDDLNLTITNKIELELDDLLLPYTFDISIKRQISNPDLVEHINRIGKVFYKKEDLI